MLISKFSFEYARKYNLKLNFLNYNFKLNFIITLNLFKIFWGKFL